LTCTDFTIYEGWVRHRRYSPFAHTFRYGLYMSYFDLAEVEAQERPPRTDVSDARLRWLQTYRRRDHFGDPDVRLTDSVRALVQSKTGWLPDGPIGLLTNLRKAGYVMNPISLYYCWDSTGVEVDAVVAEVHNTPWREMHCYILDTRSHRPGVAYRFRKDFHVSPFFGMEQDYVWRFSVPGERLVVHLQNMESNRQVFDATLVLQRRSVDSSALRRTVWRHPLMTYAVIARIYLQALRLWAKRCPYHPHPARLATSAENGEGE
jgi:uncharacterized protein